jgi:hypothetical protein
MKNHLENFYFEALLPELVNPRHQKGQPIRKILYTKRVIMLHCLIF